MAGNEGGKAADFFLFFNLIFYDIISDIIQAILFCGDFNLRPKASTQLRTGRRILMQFKAIVTENVDSGTFWKTSSRKTSSREKTSRIDIFPKTTRIRLLLKSMSA